MRVPGWAAEGPKFRYSSRRGRAVANSVFVAGIIFLVVGAGLQVYGLSQISQCVYANPPKASCGGLTVEGNGLSLFLIFVGLVAIVRTKQMARAPFASAGNAPSRVFR
jgi:hypothetical protein